MPISELLAKKRKFHKVLRDNFSFDKKTRPIWLICIWDKEILDNLIDWLSVLPADFIVSWKKEIDTDTVKSSNKIRKDLEVWFDFLVCDSDIDDLKKYLRDWIVPISPKNTYLSSLLEEFNPIKASGNSFLYDSEKWYYDIFYAIVRYLENCKFPFDNRNLVKNISEI